MNESKHLLIKSISHQKVDRTPIWIMRQAGRYLPEYIKTKTVHEWRKVSKPQLNKRPCIFLIHAH